MKLFITLLFFYFVFIPSVTAHCGTCSAGEKKEEICSVCKDREHGKHSCEKHEGKDGKEECTTCCNEKANDSTTKATSNGGTNSAPAAEGSTTPVTPEVIPPPEATPPPAEKKK